MAFTKCLYPHLRHSRQVMQTLEPATRSSPKVTLSSGAIAAAQRHLLKDDPRWQLTMRITASRSLGRSRLLSEFLLYIADRQIRGLASDITEQQIGIHVFGRAAGYDSNEDNIVRSYARSLRKRIAEYFVTEGGDEALRLDIPRGGYVPVFSQRPDRIATQSPKTALPLYRDGRVPSTSPQSVEQSSLSLSPAQGVVSTVDASRMGSVRILTRILLAVALCFGVLLLLRAEDQRTRSASHNALASAALWSDLFRQDRDTYVVPSDDGLVIMQRILQRPVPLASYVSGEYRTNAKIDGDAAAPELLKLGARRYTSVVDLDFVAHLAQLKEITPARMMVRYARDLRMDDLRTGNAILIGSVEANPWIELFEPHMNFRFNIQPGSDKLSGILNTQPHSGEEKIYGTPQKDHTFGLIAYVPNLTSTGHVLIVGGLNSAGTQAATTFLLTPSLMQPALERARTENGDFDSFELLIGAGNVAANASSPQLVIERVGHR